MGANRKTMDCSFASQQLMPSGATACLLDRCKLALLLGLQAPRSWGYLYHLYHEPPPGPQLLDRKASATDLLF